MRMPGPKVAVALGLLGSVLLGVGFWSVTHSDQVAASYRIATQSRDANFLALLGPAILEGQANNDGTACLWVGNRIDRLVLIWPRGYTAQGQPLTVLGADGKAVGRVGQRVAVGGGFSVQPSSGHRPVLGCGTPTKAWLVGGLQPLK
jgi:hypothetical protein